MKGIVYFAISIAYDTGRIIRNAFFSGDYSVKRKSDKSLVTEIDLKVEKFITSRIKTEYPNHTIYGEETTKEKSENTWYIDPIDGTTNFTKHVPFFTTSIAFESPSLSFGVVYAPLIDELYYSDGKNSYLNGKILRINDKEKPIKRAYLGMCHGKDRESLEDTTRIFSYFKLNAGEIRKFGSTSLEMCYVASSRIDAFIGRNIGLWDFKGAYYIAKHAGAYVKEENINNKPILLCSSPKLSEIIKKRLKSLI